MTHDDEVRTQEVKTNDGRWKTNGRCLEPGVLLVTRLQLLTLLLRIFLLVVPIHAHSGTYDTHAPCDLRLQLVPGRIGRVNLRSVALVLSKITNNATTVTSHDHHELLSAMTYR